MSQNAPVLIAMFLVVLALVSGAVVVANRLLRADTSEQTEPELGSEAWRTATAEVVSSLRAGNRTFLQVRFRAGRSLIRTDVLYPASQGVVPLVTQRIPIRYDPVAPARAVYDRQRASRIPPRVSESGGPDGPVTRGPLTRA